MSSHPASAKFLRFRPGPDTGCVIEGDSLIFQGHISLLQGATGDTLVQGERIEPAPGGALLTGPDTLAGVLIASDHLPLEEATFDLYARLLEHTAGWHVHRIWNLVPHINAVPVVLENYCAFNAGRHRLLSARWGHELTSRLAAASALGTRGGPPALAFSSGREPAEYFENPLQESAITYPPEYGSSPPAFARGCRLTTASGTVWHLSGTASIRGCRTIGTDIATQLGVTVENISTLCARMKVPAQRRAAWRVFLRHPEHLATAVAAVSAAWPGDMDSAIFLHADICRADLLVEIEAQFSV